MDILTICLHYISTNDLAALAKEMKFYDARPLKFNSKTFLTPIRENDKSFDEAKKILKRLNIPILKWKKYLACGSVYVFLEELSKDGFAQAPDILNVIDEKRATGKLQLVFGIIFLAALITLILLSPPLAGVLSLVQSFLGSANFIPIISLSYTGSVVIYSAYQNQFDRRRTLMSRFIDNFFLLSGAVLNVTGYILLIGASAVASPLMGALFVTAAGVDVIKSAFVLIVDYRNYNPTPSSLTGNTLADQQAAARYELTYIKNRNTLLINITSAVILVGLMAVWSFVPGGILVTVAALVGIGVVYAAKAIANKYNERIIREKLQKELNKLEKKADPSELVELEEVNPLKKLNDKGAQIDPKNRIKSVGISSAPKTTAIKPAPSAQQTNLSQKEIAGLNLGFFSRTPAVEPTPQIQPPEPHYDNGVQKPLGTHSQQDVIPPKKKLNSENSDVPSASGNK